MDRAHNELLSRAAWACVAGQRCKRAGPALLSPATMRNQGHAIATAAHVSLLFFSPASDDAAGSRCARAGGLFSCVRSHRPCPACHALLWRFLMATDDLLVA